MKRWILLLAMLACMAFLSACGGGEDDTQTEEEQQAHITRELQQSGNLRPNTPVEFSRDDKGNLQFSYENSDGSGGGGVVLD